MGLSQTGTQTSESQRGWVGGKHVPVAAERCRCFCPRTWPAGCLMPCVTFTGCDARQSQTSRYEINAVSFLFCPVPSRWFYTGWSEGRRRTRADCLCVCCTVTQRVPLVCLCLCGTFVCAWDYLVVKPIYCIYWLKYFLLFPGPSNIYYYMCFVQVSLA